MRLFSNDRLAMAADEKVPFVFLLVPGTGTHEVMPNCQNQQPPKPTTNDTITNLSEQR